MNILLSGASGFIGAELYSHFCGNEAFKVFRFFRTVPDALNSDSTVFKIEHMDAHTVFPLNEIKPEVVIHSAAVAHVRKKEGGEESFFSVNTEGTINFARQCASSGVKRFIFISSIGVNGQNSSARLDEDTPKAPYNAYTKSKSLAEDGLLDLAGSSDMDVVIIRLPLVYGANAPGNFGDLFKLASTTLPLPFGSINNHRSIIYVGNVVHFIKCCLQNPLASNQIFCLSDGVDLSLKDIISKIRINLGRPPLLFPFPKNAFRLIGFIFRREDMIEKLVGDLVVNSSKARRLIGWDPKFTVDQAFKNTVNKSIKGSE
ncbi:NAD-dependent epimerase/dehydratase family protein [Thalassolituus sp. LLYu03]|uniref:NAD-dependent epimerase/dehydratase family protein n=1 Tax=Thalassolituus sp. LLYu03 TaxID=3421656 RepID=UPI003D26AC28